MGTAVLLVAIVAAWGFLTLEGWGRQAPAPGRLAPGVSSRHPKGVDLCNTLLAPVLDPASDPRPIVGCVQRWPDLEDPPPCPTCRRPTPAVVGAVVRCRGPPARRATKGVR